MTTNLLRAALLNYLNNDTLTADDRNSIDAAIKELNEIDQRSGADDIWQHDVYFMHADAASCFMNELTYDTYGRLYAAQNGSVEYADYEHAVLKYCPTLTTAAVELGYDIVHDLYAENERLGCHNPDGTFNYNSAK